MNSITAHIWCNGDPLAGIAGCDTDVDTCLLEFSDKEHREFIRAQLEACFSKIWDEKAKVIFSDEHQLLQPLN